MIQSAQVMFIKIINVVVVVSNINSSVITD